VDLVTESVVEVEVVWAWELDEDWVVVVIVVNLSSCGDGRCPLCWHDDHDDDDDEGGWIYRHSGGGDGDSLQEVPGKGLVWELA
jgi:hypothetical protein